MKTLFEEIREIGNTINTKESENSLFEVFKQVEKVVESCVPLSETEEKFCVFFKQTSRIYLDDSVGDSISEEEIAQVRSGTNIMLSHYLPILVAYAAAEKHEAIEDLPEFRAYVNFLEKMFSTPLRSTPNEDDSISFGPSSAIIPNEFIFTLFGLPNVKSSGIYLP